MDSTEQRFLDETGGILKAIPANGFPALYRVELPDGNNLVRLSGDELVEFIFWKADLENALTAALEITLPEALVDHRYLVPEISRALNRFRKE